jgi:hypothetical protein
VASYRSQELQHYLAPFFLSLAKWRVDGLYDLGHTTVAEASGELPRSRQWAGRTIPASDN